MNSGTHASVMGNRKNKAVVETVAQIVFTICAFFAVLAVVSITLYMIISGTPAILKVGLGEILFGTEDTFTAECVRIRAALAGRLIRTMDIDEHMVFRGDPHQTIIELDIILGL